MSEEIFDFYKVERLKNEKKTNKMKKKLKESKKFQEKKKIQTEY